MGRTSVSWLDWFRRRVVARDELQRRIVVPAQWHGDNTVEIYTGPLRGVTLDLWLIAERWASSAPEKRSVEIEMVADWLNGRVDGVFERVSVPYTALQVTGAAARNGIAVCDHLPDDGDAPMIAVAQGCFATDQEALTISRTGDILPAIALEARRGWSVLVPDLSGCDVCLRATTESDLAIALARASASAYPGAKLGGLPVWKHPDSHRDIHRDPSAKLALQLPLAEVGLLVDVVVYALLRGPGVNQLEVLIESG